jgi:hypothetical protein
MLQRLPPGAGKSGLPTMVVEDKGARFDFGPGALYVMKHRDGDDRSRKERATWKEPS